MKPYYSHAGITIYHGDCRDYLPTLTADVLVTDPPYGVNLGHHAAATETRPGYLAKSGYASYSDTDENLRTIVVPSVTAALFPGSIWGRVTYCRRGSRGREPWLEWRKRDELRL